MKSQTVFRTIIIVASFFASIVGFTLNGLAMQKSVPAQLSLEQFILAARAGDSDKVSEGIASGIDINACSAAVETSRNALAEAIFEGHLHIVTLLIACPSIKVNVQYYITMTPLMLAAFRAMPIGLRREW